MFLYGPYSMLMSPPHATTTK